MRTAPFLRNGAVLVPTSFRRFVGGRDPITDTRVTEPTPDHADAAHARFQQVWEQMH